MISRNAIVASLAAFVIVAAGHIAAVHARAPQSAHVAPYAPRLTSTHDASRFEVWSDGANVDASRDAARAITLGEIVIAGDAPVKRHASPVKVWTCGAVEANKVGGSQRTCEWR